MFASKQAPKKLTFYGSDFRSHEWCLSRQTHLPFHSCPGVPTIFGYRGDIESTLNHTKSIYYILYTITILHKTPRLFPSWSADIIHRCHTLMSGPRRNCTHLPTCSWRLLVFKSPLKALMLPVPVPLFALQSINSQWQDSVHFVVLYHCLPIEKGEGLDADWC